MLTLRISRQRRTSSLARRTCPPQNLSKRSYSYRASRVSWSCLVSFVELPGFFANLYLLPDPGGQLHFFTLPELGILPIPPIKNVQAITVDQQVLTRPFLQAPIHTVEAVDFCVIKKTGIDLFSLREKLVFHRVNTIQSQPGSMFSRFNRMSPWAIADPVHVKWGLYFVSPTEKISTSSTFGGGICCP